MQLDPRRCQTVIRLQGLCHGHIRADPQIGGDDVHGFGIINPVGCCALVGHAPEPPGFAALPTLRLGHGHRNAHRRTILLVHPWMVGDGKGQAHPVLRLQMLGDDTAAEGLDDGIGGDEAEPARPCSHRECRLVPPVHDEVGALGHVGGLEQRLEIPVAQPVAHVLATNEWRVADDEIRLGPFCRAGLHIAIHLHPRVLVGHFAAGDGVQLHCFAVPAGDGLAALVLHQLALVIVDQCVAGLDGADVLQDRLRRATVLAVDAEMPLQIADPQHQLRNRRRARVDLYPQEILGRDRVAGQLGQILVVAQFLEQFQHLALQLLHPRHGDIEEVAGTAGRIEHLGLCQLGVERLHHRAGGIDLVFAHQAFHRAANPVPVAAKRFHDGGGNQTLDIGSGGVMRAQLGAFLGVERAFEQRAEDCRFDLSPVLARRLDQHQQFFAFERQGLARLEQVSVEMLDRNAE